MLTFVLMVPKQWWERLLEPQHESWQEHKTDLVILIPVVIISFTGKYFLGVGGNLFHVRMSLVKQEKLLILTTEPTPFWYPAWWKRNYTLSSAAYRSIIVASRKRMCSWVASGRSHIFQETSFLFEKAKCSYWSWILGRHFSKMNTVRLSLQRGMTDSICYQW